MLEKGLKESATTVVSAANVAATVGSGDLEVFATPMMIALMENAAMRTVASALPQGSTTVGTLMNASHVRATPAGDTVTAEAHLIEVEGRKLVFEVKAEDSLGLIGEGRHERFIVDVEKFMSKLKR